MVDATCDAPANALFCQILGTLPSQFEATRPTLPGAQEFG